MDKNLEIHELTLNKLMKYAISQLAIIESIEDDTEAYLESQLILSYLFQTAFINLRVNFAKYKNSFDLKKLNRLLIRRISGEPLAYITSEKYFYDLTFSVGYGVLIPRAETELLVEHGIKELNKMQIDTDKINVVDIGTGSGAIIVSIAKNTKVNSSVNFFAIDNSDYALNFCRENIKKYNLDERVTVIKSDLLDEFHLTPHLIFANLPYIEDSDMPELQKEIRISEPSNALNGGKDGLEIISGLLKQLSESIDLNKCTIILEIGINQDKNLKKIIDALLPKFNLKFINDYQKIKRIAVIKNKN